MNLSEQGKCILLVEDNADDAALTVDALRANRIANSYIRKPVNFEDFIGAIEQISMYWLVVNEPPGRAGTSQAAPNGKLLS